MNTLAREQILKEGKARLHVKRAGMLQFQDFAVKRIKAPHGEYPVLFLDKFVDISETLRLAEELQLPIETKNGTVYPKGKTSKDFVGL